jgi:hypothetical protein
VVTVINVLRALVIIHFERSNPRAVMLWPLLVLVFSSFGLVLYFLFGWSMHRIRRRYRRKEAKDRKGLEVRLLVDGAVASIGSANWDIRSFMLNFETNAIIYCRSVAVRLEEAFFQDLTNCREWTLQDHPPRSPWLKAKCAFSRLFSPVL